MPDALVPSIDSTKALPAAIPARVIRRSAAALKSGNRWGSCCIYLKENRSINSAR
jgi:hypothetical protein